MTLSRNRRWLLVAIACGLALLPQAAYADFIWPPMLIAYGVSAWPAIIVGLIIEYFFLRLAFRLNLRTALLADVAMNGVSFGLGWILWRLIYPSATTALLETFKHLVGPAWMLVELLAVFFGSVLVSTLSEQAVLKIGFRTSFSWRGFRWLLAANTTSSVLAIVGSYLWDGLGLKNP